MSDGFWENEDMMSEEEASQVETDASVSEEEELLEDSEDMSESEDDLEILRNARLRLEQGRLYEMLLKHDLFEGVDADKKVVANVQKEIRTFIKERLEILVGLRTDPRLKPQTLNPGAFSEVELQVLKEFVGRVAKPKPQEQRPAAIKSASSSQGLKPVSQNSNVKVNPVKQKTSAKPQKKATEEAGPGLTKAPSQMTLEELKEYNRDLSARQASRKAAVPSKKLPMPDSAQVETLYAQRVQTDPSRTLVGAIMSKMGKTVTVMENVGDGGFDDGDNNSRM